MTTKLSLSTLSELGESVGTPQYTREQLSPGIVHIGVGNFHRAHQAVYLDQLFNKGLDHDWAIIGAGVKSYDKAMRDRLAGQDWLTTVVELEPNGLSARVTGVMTDFADIDPAALIATLIRPEMRIVSLTITEGGYYVDAKTGQLDLSHHEILSDIENPDAPQTIFGILIVALGLRKDSGLEPFTILSCDNLPENGHVARQTVVGLAKQMVPDLAGWIETNVAFPSSMVDCITPATSAREVALVAQKFGIQDDAPVACEPFRQWVMEDRFPAGRPALEEVGVQFVEDVAPYELMKLRILNGGHAAIAYPSALLGYHFVHEAMADPDISGWFKKLARTDVIPVVPPISGIDFDEYLETCVLRFANPEIGDTVARLCLDGSNRQPKFILPTIADALQAGRSIEGLALEVAFWCRYCAESALENSGFVLEDERAEQLRDAAEISKDSPSAFLALDDVFGDLGRNDVFAEAFDRQLKSLWESGTRETLQAYLSEGSH